MSESDAAAEPGQLSTLDEAEEVVAEGEEEAEKGLAESSESSSRDEGLIVEPRLAGPVLVSDRVAARQRRAEDLVEAGAAVLGIALTLLVGVYAPSTTQGVEEDFREAFGQIVRQILFMPVSVLESLFVIAAPVAVMVTLLMRREFSSVINTVLTGVASALLGWGFLLSVPHLPAFMQDALVIQTPTGRMNTVNVVFVVLIAMLTVAGTAASSRAIRYSWIGVWVLMLLAVVGGTETLPGVLLTVFLGRLLGCVARWIVGFDDGRATPADLVDACLNTGLVPVRIVRADVETEDEPLETWEVVESSDTPDFRRGQYNPPLTTVALETARSEVELTAQIEAPMGREYQVWLADGPLLDMHVADPEMGLMSLAGDVWQNLRLKGLTRWISPGTKPAAERGMLTAASAAAAGVRTPRPIGLAEAGTSVAVFWETLPPVASLHDYAQSGGEVTDEVLDQAWTQLARAHERGICHRAIDLHSVSIDESMGVWLLDWNQGDVGGSGVARLTDCAQMLVYLALVSDAPRAVASARRLLGDAELLSTGLMLQSAILPRGLRQLARKEKVLDQLRDQLATIAPSERAPEPMKVQRFSPKTVIMAALLVGVLVAVVGSLNFDAIVEAVKQANPWWILVAFLVGSLSWVGAAIPIVAFAPKKVSLWHTTLVQAAASVIALVAPAGVGPAAVNLRYLNRQKISTPVGLATVTLVQVSQFLTSVLLLLAAVVLTGASVNFEFPTTAAVGIFAALATVVAAAFSIPRLRKWIASKVTPWWNQAYPQLMWILGHPKELAIAFGGNLLMNLSLIAAFGASLAAFGVSLNPVSLAVTYLVSVTLGSVIPTPGGIGPVEAALTGGLQLAGVPPAIALSTAVVFRLVTFYGRIPLGWLAMRRIEKKGLL